MTVRAAPAAGGRTTAAVSRHRPVRWAAPVAAVWSTLTALVGLAWFTAAWPHPFDDEVARALGSGLHTVNPRVGVAVTLSVGILGVGGASRLLLLRDAGAAVRRKPVRRVAGHDPPLGGPP